MLTVMRVSVTIEPNMQGGSPARRVCMSFLEGCWLRLVLLIDRRLESKLHFIRGESCRLAFTGRAGFFQLAALKSQGFPMAGAIYLGKYEVIKLLGEGGMGRVFLAHQLDLKRDVVVKVLHDHIS